jgi:membrane protein YdbS with pleckstrin-like domain
VVMAKNKKSSTRKKTVYSKIKDPVKPKWMRVAKVITMILLGILLLMAIAGIIIRYYHHISNHK